MFSITNIPVVHILMPKANTPTHSPARTRVKRRPKATDENSRLGRTLPDISERKEAKHVRREKLIILTPNISNEQLQSPPTSFTPGVQDPILEKHAELMKNGLNRLVHQVDKFQQKVQDLVQDFQDLRDALEEGEQRFDALEDDLNLAWEAVAEEKETARQYYGQLKNAERQVELLAMELSESYESAAFTGISQAKI
ncbi:hypothetical protein EST38_g7803 [Candolleomyces aberdarensis]|uniref:Uncharacterized protein n=1 Tax=Candolleomyces aberdarensis TaxID=2316362 RepID=A0A4Q2DE83_9AGAR|nr:hypothetical protein EST38_g7803 [Candolleomyces aberdarensis]